MEAAADAVTDAAVDPEAASHAEVAIDPEAAVDPEAASDPPLPPDPPRLRGRLAAFHCPSYSALPGRPVTRDAPVDDPEAMAFPKKAKTLVLFYQSLCFLAQRTPFGDDVLPLSVPAIAKRQMRSTRWVYKALHHLSYYGYVYLVPAPPGPDGRRPEAERVVCQRVPVPGTVPVKTYVPPAAEVSDPPAAGEPSPARPEDPRPAVPPRGLPPEVDVGILIRVARHEKVKATPPLGVLKDVPPGDQKAFRTVVTKLVAERFGSVQVDPRRRRMRLPTIPEIHDPDGPDKLGFGPYVVERAIDAGTRRHFVEELEAAFKSAAPDDEDLQYQPKVLMRPWPPHVEAVLDVRRISEARGFTVVLDGAAHPDLPGYIAIGGCLHAPEGICRCGIDRLRPQEIRAIIREYDEVKVRPDVPDEQLHKL